MHPMVNTKNFPFHHFFKEKNKTDNRVLCERKGKLGILGSF